jgi:PUA domain protein
MFKTFKPEEHLGNQQLAKSSVARGIRASIVEVYPRLGDVIDNILVNPLMLIKGKGDFAFFTFLVANNEIVFLQSSGKDSPWLPTLRVLHQYPSMMHKMQVDTGAIKFVLRGAHVMSPGLLEAKGGAVEKNLPVGTPVQITADKCDHACGVGILSVESNDIGPDATGQAVESVHCLGDGLWKNYHYKK